jgi:hypothetical protein
MIAWLILGILLAVLGITVRAYRVSLRVHRQRRSLRHVVGIEEWWGKR